MAQDVAVAGNYAYIADLVGGVYVVDVSNPAAPIQAGLYDLPGEAYSITMAGTLVYVADNDAGLYTLRFFPHQVYLPLVLRN